MALFGNPAPSTMFEISVEFKKKKIKAPGTVLWMEYGIDYWDWMGPGPGI